MDKEYYHVYNRGVDKRNIFEDKKDALRFLSCMELFNTTQALGGVYTIGLLEKRNKRHSMSRIVEFVAYCLNQNHYHFIISPLVENGVQKFMQRLSNGYTKYFNEKYRRSGALFQGRYKRKLIETNEYLLHLSCYVNLNNLVHEGLNEQWLNEEGFSSFNQYIGKDGKGIFCSSSVIIDQYNDLDTYNKQALNRLQSIIQKKKTDKELAKILLE